MKKSLRASPVIAHRGAKTFAPENTIAAFKIAKQKGATWIEFDVQLSADDQLFVFHDDDLRRTTHVKGLARELTLDELKKLDAGAWFDAKFAGERIPSLTETMECLIELKLNANIEIKSCGEPEYDARLAAKVCEFLKKLPANLPIKLLVSSFSFEALEIVRANLPKCPLGMLLEITRWPHFIKHIAEIKAEYKKLNCVSLNVNQDILTKDRVRTLNFSEQILTFTVNKPARAKALFAWGVDGVFSDHVDLMTQFD
ncbi:MAG: glycerophosphodiester phosphodiesterase family protein [Gammaproteobacteria bacterium]|nr:glycerophosphodiester phosphodiesterase family protein [Gammaproteobacteria bacterium]